MPGSFAAARVRSSFRRIRQCFLGFVRFIAGFARRRMLHLMQHRPPEVARNATSPSAMLHLLQQDRGGCCIACDNPSGNVASDATTRASLLATCRSAVRRANGRMGCSPAGVKSPDPFKRAIKGSGLISAPASGCPRTAKRVGSREARDGQEMDVVACGAAAGRAGVKSPDPFKNEQ